MKPFLSWRYRCFSVCTVFPEPWKSCFPLRSDLKYFHARTGLVSHSHHLDVAPSSLLECLRKPQSRRRLWITPQKKKTCPRFRFQARSYLASPGMFSSYCAHKKIPTYYKSDSARLKLFFSVVHGRKIKKKKQHNFAVETDQSFSKERKMKRKAKQRRKDATKERRKE